jgi:hypothetical protein
MELLLDNATLSRDGYSMPYKINYEKEQNYIEVTVEGDFALSTLKDLATDVAKFIDQYGCNRVLNNMRQAKLTEDSLDIYNMPQSANNAGIVHRHKRALVVSEHSSDFHFLETVFINQGHNVKMFTDINEAMYWLLDKEKPKHEPGD